MFSPSFCLFFRTFAFLMRRFLYYLLLLHLATGGIVGESMVQIPRLVEHYNYHKTESPACTFFDFLEVHYSVFNNSHADKRHAALPFHCHKVQPTGNCFLLPVVFQILQSGERPNDRLKSYFIYDFQLPSGFATTFSPPPKLC